MNKNNQGGEMECLGVFDINLIFQLLIKFRYLGGNYIQTIVKYKEDIVLFYKQTTHK